MLCAGWPTAGMNCCFHVLFVGFGSHCKQQAEFVLIQGYFCVKLIKIQFTPLALNLSKENQAASLSHPYVSVGLLGLSCLEKNLTSPKGQNPRLVALPDTGCPALASSPFHSLPMSIRTVKLAAEEIGSDFVLCFYKLLVMHANRKCSLPFIFLTRTLLEVAIWRGLIVVLLTLFLECFSSPAVKVSYSWACTSPSGPALSVVQSPA